MKATALLVGLLALLGSGCRLFSDREPTNGSNPIEVEWGWHTPTNSPPQ